MKGTGKLFTHCRRVVLSILVGCMFCVGSPTAKAQLTDPTNASLNASEIVRMILDYIQDALGLSDKLSNLESQLETAKETYDKFAKYAEWVKKATQAVNTVVTNYRALEEVKLNYELIKGDWERARAEYEFYKNMHLDIDPRYSTITLGNALTTAKNTLDLATDLLGDADAEFEFLGKVVGVGGDGRAIWEMDAGERLALIRETNDKLRRRHEAFCYIAELHRSRLAKMTLEAAVKRAEAEAWSHPRINQEVDKVNNDFIINTARSITADYRTSSSGSSGTSTDSENYSPYSSTLKSVEKMFTNKGTIDNVFSIVLYGILGLAALLAPLAYMRVVKGEVQHRDAMFNLMAGLVAMILIVQVVRLVLFGS